MGIKVLVIEDDEEIADFVVRGLREEGYTVEAAANGEDGWHALRHGPWDVVILDWWLPGADGLTLLRRFREAGHTTAVLFLTARDAVSDKVAWPGQRGRRLPLQAVRLRGAARPSPVTGTPAGPGNDHHPERSGCSHRPGDPPRRAGGRAARSDRQGTSPARSSSCDTRARCCRAPGFTSTSGMSATMEYPTRWSFMSWNCGESWRPMDPG